MTTNYKSFNYRIYPNKTQAQFIESQIDAACDLYNAALQERRDAYRVCKRHISYYEQSAQLKYIRAEGLTDIKSQACAQNVLMRADRAYKLFWKNTKGHKKTSLPRFKSKNRYHSITISYKNGAYLTENNKLHLLGTSDIKIKLHRPIAGTIKIVTISREDGKYFVTFVCECATNPVINSNNKSVGIDLGLTSFAVFSTGEVIKNPRHYITQLKTIRLLDRSVSRKQKGSNNRKKARRILRKLYHKIRRRRQDFHHKLSNSIVTRFDTIVVEDLNIIGLSRSALSKFVFDASWGMFLRRLERKAASAGKKFIKVNPYGTSQRCSRCGSNVRKPLSMRQHVCPSCHLNIDRDLNSALEILRLGLSQSEVTCDISQSVSDEFAIAKGHSRS